MIKWRKMSGAVKNTRKMKSNLKRAKHGEKMSRKRASKRVIEWV